MNDFVEGEPSVASGRGFFDLASTYVETVGETIQTGIETVGGVFSTGIETAGDTLQAFPEAAAELGPEEVTISPTYAPQGQGSMLPLGIAAIAGLGVAYYLSTR